jgi:serine-type D-Ala-D-Ala endopeptidase (penicillin-binding protein 7)
MSRSALGVAISLLAFALALPASQAEAKAAKAPAKKTVQKKARSKSSRARPPVVSLTNQGADRQASAQAKRKPGVQRASFAPSAGAAAVAGAGVAGAAAAAGATAPATPAAAPAPVYTVGDLAGLNATRDPLALKSNAAIVVDAATSQVLFEKNAGFALPIASLTKLMTALIVIEAKQDMEEVLEVTDEDVDREKFSHSRLRIGSFMSRANMLHIALMSSENRAASALGRHYPGGLPAFVAAMNAKAKVLGMTTTRFVDSTGLSSQNMASARDLAKLVVAAHHHPVIRGYSTDTKYAVNAGRYTLNYMNSNRLVMNSHWDIDLQKTGYITEAGRCLLMHTRIDNRPVVMVFLDSKGKDSRLADAGRVRKWLETSRPQNLVQATARQG